MFRFKYDGFWRDLNEKYNGYTQYEASEKAKGVILSLKDKIWPHFIEMKPWLDADFVMDIVRPGGEEDYRAMVNRGDLKDDEGYAGYEWRITT